jgi:hypothetical protein
MEDCNSPLKIRSRRKEEYLRVDRVGRRRKRDRMKTEDAGRDCRAVSQMYGQGYIQGENTTRLNWEPITSRYAISNGATGQCNTRNDEREGSDDHITRTALFSRAIAFRTCS